VFAATLVLLALTDVLDGRIARQAGIETRMGRMLDPMADVSYLAFLAAGLFAAGVLPGSLFALLMLRYPGALIAVVVLYFVRGPAALRPTVIGRAAGVVTHAVLIGLALALLLRPEWLQANWIDWPVRALYVVVGVNVTYLAYRVVTWDTADRGTTG
jgi:cardiolipin synthase